VKTIGVVLVTLAMIIGILPQFTDCMAQGGALQLSNGSTLPMRCHWTRQAEVAVALPLGVVGAVVLVNRRRQTLRVALIIGIALSAAAVLLPTYLIGVCASEDMVCNMVMKPALVFAGVVATLTNLVGLVYLRGDMRPSR